MHLITGSKFWRTRTVCPFPSLSFSLFFLLTFRRREKWMARFVFDDKKHDTFARVRSSKDKIFFYTRCICPRRNLILILPLVELFRHGSLQDLKFQKLEQNEKKYPNLILIPSGIVSERIAPRFKISETGTKRQKVSELNFNFWWNSREMESFLKTFSFFPKLKEY